MTLVNVDVFLDWFLIFMKQIYKKYAEIMHQAEIAIGRKEVVRPFKKAAKVRSNSDARLVA